ncbi:MAG: hypothetical protein LBH06_09585 [Rikenellaceae bacterium]|jgi:hypothetical protein|nr:hypothetical protein [Rikenellaceae bacterium]
MLSFKTILALQVIRELDIRPAVMAELKGKLRLPTCNSALMRTMRLLKFSSWISSGPQLRLLVDPSKVTLYDLVMLVDDGRLQLDTHVWGNYWAPNAEKNMPNLFLLNNVLQANVAELLRRTTVGQAITAAE